MQKYDAIESGIEQGDAEALREAIGSICYTSRDFSSGEFDEAVRYVESKGIALKDPGLVGSPTISSQKTAFTDEDFARAVFELKKNFCDERIRDVKTIGKELYGTDPNVTDPNAAGHQNGRGKVICGLVAAAVVILIILLLILLTA